MLHELVHNVQGPHNAAFYKLLDEITEVFETVEPANFGRSLLTSFMHLLWHGIHCPCVN